MRRCGDNTLVVASIMARLHLDMNHVSIDTTEAKDVNAGIDESAKDIELEMSIPNIEIISSGSMLRGVVGLETDSLDFSNNNFNLSANNMSKIDLDNFQSPNRKQMQSRKEKQKDVEFGFKKTLF